MAADQAAELARPLPPMSLGEVSFDEAINGAEGLPAAVRESGKAKLAAALGLSKDAVSAVESAKGARKLEVVFTPETVKKLKSGEYHLPIDKKMGLQRVDARDAQGRIRELGKTRHVGKAKVALNLVVSAAHIISAADMKAQLDEIDRKLDQILTFIHADRLGELRGVFNGLRKTLGAPQTPERDRELRAWSRELDKLEGRFYETAKAKLEAIEDPSKISAWKALTTLQSTAKERLEQDLAAVLLDLKAMAFSSFLQQVVLADIGEPERMAEQRQAQLDNKDGIAGILKERLGYLSFDLRDAAAEKLDLLELAPPATDTVLLTAGGESYRFVETAGRR